MSKHGHTHDPAGGRKALAYGSMEGFGPMLNTRHPKKFKLDMKKPPAGAANTDEGKQTTHDT